MQLLLLFFSLLYHFAKRETFGEDLYVFIILSAIICQTIFTIFKVQVFQQRESSSGHTEKCFDNFAQKLSYERPKQFCSEAKKICKTFRKISSVQISPLET